MDHTLGTRMLDALADRPPHALLVTELRARLGASSRPDFEAALRGALCTGDVLVVDHASPDPHLAGDLRVVALATPPALDPAANAETVWITWMRDVLSAHRCC